MRLYLNWIGDFDVHSWQCKSLLHFARIIVRAVLNEILVYSDFRHGIHRIHAGLVWIAAAA